VRNCGFSFLGPQFGGAIGILFAAANAISVALYIIGFAETIQEQVQPQEILCSVRVLIILTQVGTDITQNGDWDLQVYGMGTLLVLWLMCMGGINWIIKIQLLLLAVLVLCIISVFVGPFVIDHVESQGTRGLSI